MRLSNVPCTGRIDVICLSIHLASSRPRVSSNLHINHPPTREEWKVFTFFSYKRKKKEREKLLEVPLQREMERNGYNLSYRFVISPAEVAGGRPESAESTRRTTAVSLLVCCVSCAGVLPFHTLLCVCVCLYTWKSSLFWVLL